MVSNLGTAFISNFLGQSPKWYKKLIITFLVINPVIFLIDPFLAGWVLIIEFILTWPWRSSVTRCNPEAC